MSQPVWNALWKCWLILDPQNAAFSIRVEPQPPAPQIPELDNSPEDRDPPGYPSLAEEAAQYRKARTPREDSPTVENCDDWGTGEGAYHGRI